MSNTKRANQKTLIILSLIFVVSIIVTLLSGFIGLVIDPGNICVVEHGRIYQEETTYGYIVREEKTLYGQNYKNGLVEIKSEGSPSFRRCDNFPLYSHTRFLV